MRDAKDLVVWITGAGTGIGEASAERLAKDGAIVILSGRRAEPLQEAANRIEKAGGKAHVEQLDVSDRDAVNATAARILEKFGKIDVLFNNHGINTRERRWNGGNLEDWDALIDINLKGVYNCTYAVLPSMRERKDGLVINTASMAGQRYSPKAGVAYGASKHAVLAMNEILNLEEGNNGIRACAISPGEVNTAILDYRPVQVPMEERVQLVQSEDVAETVLFVVKMHPRATLNEILITPTRKRPVLPGEA